MVIRISFLDSHLLFSATIKSEDAATQSRWLPRLKPFQEQLRDLAKRLEVLRNTEISRKTTGGSDAAAGSASGGSAAAGGGRAFGRPVSGTGGGMGGADVMETQVVQEKRTVTIARDMLRTVNETTDMGAAALTELDRQGGLSLPRVLCCLTLTPLPCVCHYVFNRQENRYCAR